MTSRSAERKELYLACQGNTPEDDQASRTAQEEDASAKIAVQVIRLT
jgi:hypothetical protein